VHSYKKVPTFKFSFLEDTQFCSKSKAASGGWVELGNKRTTNQALLILKLSHPSFVSLEAMSSPNLTAMFQRTPSKRQTKAKSRLSFDVDQVRDRAFGERHEVFVTSNCTVNLKPVPEHENAAIGDPFDSSSTIQHPDDKQNESRPVQV
jgi:hypothetical protein